MNYIERNANRGFGMPVIVGRRLTVFNVITLADNTGDVHEQMREFELSMDELKSAIQYCMGLRCKDMSSPTDQYCDGCIRRSISQGWTSMKDDFEEKDSYCISKDGYTILLGSMEEAEDDEFGVMGWGIAERLAKRLADAGI